MLPAIASAVYALALIALLGVVEPAPLELPPPDAGAASPGPPPGPESRFRPSAPIRAVQYAGHESPLNFWNSDLSDLERDFARIRRDGFDTVLVAIPWGEFQPALFPPRLDPGAFRRLKRLVRAAGEHELGVVARVSYARDVEPGSQLPTRDRLRFVYGDEHVYRAWLSYVRAVAETLTGFRNFRFAVLSWEDFWGVVTDARTIEGDELRRRLAVDTGFDDHLSARFALEGLSERYGRRVESWQDIRVGPPGTPEFELFVAFVRESLRKRFYAAARKEFPDLSLEVPPGDGGRPARPSGGAFATVSFSPASGASSGAGASATAALRRLAQRLRGARRSSRARVFLGRLALPEGSFGSVQGGGTRRRELRSFVRCSEPLLRTHTLGYALERYPDRAANTVFNPSFALGLEGWRARGGARVVGAGGRRALRLPPGAHVLQAVRADADPGSASSRDLHVELVARAAPGARSQLTIGVDRLRRSVSLEARPRRVRVSFPRAELGSYELTVVARRGGARVADVAVYGFVERGSVRGRQWQPGPALEAVQRLNASLARPRGRSGAGAECTGMPRR